MAHGDRRRGTAGPPGSQTLFPRTPARPALARRRAIFLKEFVVLFGFLNGVWVAVGLNPGATLLETLQGFLFALTGGVGALEFVFALLPTVLLALMIYLILRKGGWLGLVAVLAGFVGGMQIVTNPKASLALLVVSMGLGWLATR